MPRSAAAPAATRNSSSGRPCWRQEATTVSSRSATGLPAWLSEPKLPLGHSTAGRRARSDTLLVGSTPSTRAKVHSPAHHLSNSRQSAAALRSELSCPRPNNRPRWARTGTSRWRNSARSNSPARKHCHRQIAAAGAWPRQRHPLHSRERVRKAGTPGCRRSERWFRVARTEGGRPPTMPRRRAQRSGVPRHSHDMGPVM